MPPNNKYKEIVQIALPYDQPAYKLGPQLDEPPVYYQASSSHQELADEDEDEPSLQVTTRARVTYELDRYNKNEMLIISNSSTDPTVMMYILNVFREHKFGFTVIETEEDDENEIWQKIDQFFQKDFSNIGVAAVVTMMSSQEPQALPSRPNYVQEWDVLNYFMDNQPPTLNGRPKIFISEAPEPSMPPQMTSLPMDTLLIQAKKVTHERGVRPLELLCYKLTSMAGKRELLDLVSELNYEASQAYPTHVAPIRCLSTMTKDLLMEKEENEHSKEENVQRLMLELLEDPNLLQIYARLNQLIKSNDGSSSNAELDETASALPSTSSSLSSSSSLTLSSSSSSSSLSHLPLPSQPSPLSSAHCQPQLSSSTLSPPLSSPSLPQPPPSSLSQPGSQHGSSTSAVEWDESASPTPSTSSSLSSSASLPLSSSSSSSSLSHLSLPSQPSLSSSVHCQSQLSSSTRSPSLSSPSSPQPPSSSSSQPPLSTTSIVTITVITFIVIVTMLQHNK